MRTKTLLVLITALALVLAPLTGADAKKKHRHHKKDKEGSGTPTSIVIDSVSSSGVVLGHIDAGGNCQKGRDVTVEGTNGDDTATSDDDGLWEASIGTVGSGDTITASVEQSKAKAAKGKKHHKKKKGKKSKGKACGADSTSSSELHRVTVAVTGNGHVSSDPSGVDNCRSGPTGSCSALFGRDGVTLAATPDSGQTFTSWGGACSGNASTCEVNTDSDKNVTATFSGAASDCPIPDSVPEPVLGVLCTVVALLGG